jgi:hypothetical protein
MRRLFPEAAFAVKRSLLEIGELSILLPSGSLKTVDCGNLHAVDQVPEQFTQKLTFGEFGSPNLQYCRWYARNSYSGELLVDCAPSDADARSIYHRRIGTSATGSTAPAGTAWNYHGAGARKPARMQFSLAFTELRAMWLKYSAR